MLNWSSSSNRGNSTKMEAKLMEEFKQADDKQRRFIGLMEDVHKQSSAIITFGKDLEVQYSAIRDSLRLRAQQLDVQATRTEEARKKVEAEEMEVQMKMQAAQEFLDKAREKEKAMSLLDAELQGKEKLLAEMKSSIRKCNAEFEARKGYVETVKNLISAKEKESSRLEKEVEKQHEEINLNRVHLQECDAELQTKAKKLDLIATFLEATVKDIELKEAELSSIQTSIKAKDQLLREKIELHNLIDSKMEGCRNHDRLVVELQAKDKQQSINHEQRNKRQFGSRS